MFDVDMVAAVVMDVDVDMNVAAAVDGAEVAEGPGRLSFLVCTSS